MLRHDILGTTTLWQARVRLRPTLVNFDMIHRITLERLVEEIETPRAEATVLLMAERRTSTWAVVVHQRPRGVVDAFRSHRFVGP
jgi:hypothetical protein